MTKWEGGASPSARKVTIALGTVDESAVVVLRQVSEEWSKSCIAMYSIFDLTSFTKTKQYSALYCSYSMRYTEIADKDGEKLLVT